MMRNIPFEETGILPVINIPSVEKALPLAKALIDGGIYAIEVTLRSACSLEAIKIIKEHYPEMVVGAGTVFDTTTVDKALEAGAEFIVSPGYDPELVDYCIKKGVLITPGCVTASDIQAGLKQGIRIFKYFPAELNGGIEAIKLLSGPFADAKFIPTGGINYSNLGTYLANEKIVACGGSYMATADMIKNDDWQGITAACKRAIDISLGFELAHVGINCQTKEEAYKGAKGVSDVFRMQEKVGNSSTFAGTAVEFMHNPYYGTNGHIGFRTNSVARALSYFNNRGFEILEDSVRKDEAGKLVSAYLKNEIGGFALHVVRK